MAAGTDAQFAAVGGGDSHTAATTTGERIMFAPGAAQMNDDSLRIVLRHELFHYAARAETAADAPRWLTEGVADYVARPPTPLPANSADDGAAGTPDRRRVERTANAQLAYDRAWWFSRFVAGEYGPAALRSLYIRACGHGHPDLAAAVQDTLGTDVAGLLAAVAAVAGQANLTGDEPGPAGYQRFSAPTWRHSVVPAGTGGPPGRYGRSHADRVRAQVEGVRRVRPGRRLRGGATPDHVDAARTVCRQADAATHRTSQRRHRVVRGGRTAGTDGAARS